MHTQIALLNYTRLCFVHARNPHVRTASAARKQSAHTLALEELLLLGTVPADALPLSFMRWRKIANAYRLRIDCTQAEFDAKVTPAAVSAYNARRAANRARYKLVRSARGQPSYEAVKNNTFFVNYIRKPTIAL